MGSDTEEEGSPLRDCSFMHAGTQRKMSAYLGHLPPVSQVSMEEEHSESISNGLQRGMEPNCGPAL